MKVTLHAGKDNDNFESLLKALPEERPGSGPRRGPIEELVRNKLLRETEFTTLVHAVRREYTAFSASSH